MMTFEGAFLAQLQLANGKTVMEHAEDTGLLRINNG